ncbi:MAG: hypothetical protein U9R00_00270 [Patescibacteria group bacterium]|nr:hypothetical protein [Patescibacteria group bacterium]
MSETHKIKDINRKLYDRDGKLTQRHREGILHPKNYKVSEKWKKVDKKIEKAKFKPSFFKKVFIISVIFFICAAAFAVFMYFKGANSISNENIEISVLGNSFTQGGEELPLQIEIINKNNANLELANLIIEYPRGASDSLDDTVRLPRESLGTIKAGQRIEKNIKIALYGEQGSIRNVKVKLEYHPEGSNAIFSKEKEYPVTISSTPISMLIDAPEKISSNQEIIIKITTSLNTNLPSDQTLLKVDYPSGFVFENANIKSDFSNSLWDISSLTKTEPSIIIIKGRIVGQVDDEQSFHFFVGTSKNNKSDIDVVYNSFLHTIEILKPFLETQLIINGQNSSEYFISGGETVNASILWSNNLSTRVADAQIIITFSGNAFDKFSVSPEEGFYDSTNNRIVWNRNTVSELNSVEPGQSGSVIFSFTPISLIGSNQIKDPQVTMEVSIKGKEPQEGLTFSDINNFKRKVVKIISNFQLANSATYRLGPLPPKAENETEYGITWTLSNSANIITQAKARAYLPVYVDWVGSYQNQNEDIRYNSANREVIWNIGTVQPNTGFNSINREVSFVVSLKPSVSQVGSIPQLIKTVYLTGKDSFVNSQVKSSYKALSAYLINDPSYTSGDERVVQ